MTADAFQAKWNLIDNELKCFTPDQFKNIGLI